MKKTLFIAFLLSTIFSVGQELKVNAESAKIGFNFINESTKGTLKGLAATIKFDVSNLSVASISGTVDVSTISTGNGTRDKHLKSGEYFDAAKYPKISFKSSSITKDGNGYKMVGKLKIKDVEKEVTFNFTYEGKVFKGKATIYSSDFGISMKKKREMNQVDISIEIPVL
ncbi:MAG: YceI family protein [Crocinitomicaceae bacterium]|nr:YceI family protein [Crocinitomicaceae bacterium]